jgi:hypothetical protein
MIANRFEKLNLNESCAQVSSCTVAPAPPWLLMEHAHMHYLHGRARTRAWNHVVPVASRRLLEPEVTEKNPGYATLPINRQSPHVKIAGNPNRDSEFPAKTRPVDVKRRGSIASAWFA